jgi:hypothetical protein
MRTPVVLHPIGLGTSYKLSSPPECLLAPGKSTTTGKGFCVGSKGVYLPPTCHCMIRHLIDKLECVIGRMGKG